MGSRLPARVSSLRPCPARSSPARARQATSVRARTTPPPTRHRQARLAVPPAKLPRARRRSARSSPPRGEFRPVDLELRARLALGRAPSRRAVAPRSALATGVPEVCLPAPQPPRALAVGRQATCRRAAQSHPAQSDLAQSDLAQSHLAQSHLAQSHLARPLPGRTVPPRLAWALDPWGRDPEQPLLRCRRVLQPRGHFSERGIPRSSTVEPHRFRQWQHLPAPLDAVQPGRHVPGRGTPWRQLT